MEAPRSASCSLLGANNARGGHGGDLFKRSCVGGFQASLFSRFSVRFSFHDLRLSLAMLVKLQRRHFARAG
jgi:hypothetical protein